MDLKALRKKAGLSQAALAKELGVGQSAVANYECGLRSLSLEQASRIVQVLRDHKVVVSFDEVFKKESA